MNYASNQVGAPRLCQPRILRVPIRPIMPRFVPRSLLLPARQLPFLPANQRTYYVAARRRDVVGLSLRGVEAEAQVAASSVTSEVSSLR